MVPKVYISTWSSKILIFLRPGLPKRFQTFLFFRVKNQVDFKNRLKTFIPKITTGQDASEMGEIIRKAKKEAELARRSAKLLGLPGINIAFTSTGLEAVSCRFNSSPIALNKY
jgi:hypothetical protein